MERGRGGETSSRVGHREKCRVAVPVAPPKHGRRVLKGSILTFERARRFLWPIGPCGAAEAEEAALCAGFGVVADIGLPAEKSGVTKLPRRQGRGPAFLGPAQGIVMHTL